MIKGILLTALLGLVAGVGSADAQTAGVGTSAPQATVPPNYLSTELRSSGFQLTQSSLETWRAQRKKTLLEKIAALPDSVKTSLEARADKYLGYAWPALEASLYHEYKVTGNRSHYEAKLGERQNALGSLVIGALVSRNPKYLPQIVNGLWVTLEQSTWVLPAHVGVQRMGTDLPDPDEQIVDLIDGETAASISAIQFMLGDELETYSPVINKRIRYELQKRVVLPYLERSDFWWMGFKGGKPNNWNPWINSNVLSTVLLTGRDADTVNRVITKVLASTDLFVNGYGPDGGCEEGPGYWSEAGGKFIRILDLLGSVSGGKLDWKGVSLLHNMGSYIYKMHIAGTYFVNFADAAPRSVPDAGSVFQFGDYFGDDTLRGFGAYLFVLGGRAVEKSNVNEFLLAADLFDRLVSTTSKSPEPASEWMPDLQVWTGRSGGLAASGSVSARSGVADMGSTPPGALFLAVQGGNNGESHNHNDVGNFIVYVGAQPVIVDAGVGTYTAKTFSRDRYTLWNMQSQWHNCPVINGQQQMDGSQYRAGDLLLTNKKKEEQLSMDVSRAYPETSKVAFWKRTYTLEKDKPVIDLDEHYELTAWIAPSSINFLTSCTILKPTQGEVDFVDKGGKTLLTMTFDPAVLDVQAEEKKMDDDRLKSNWGDHLLRISCIIKNKELKGNYRFVFALPKS
jgi:hypothetical protein